MIAQPTHNYWRQIAAVAIDSVEESVIARDEVGHALFRLRKRGRVVNHTAEGTMGTWRPGHAGALLKWWSTTEQVEKRYGLTVDEIFPAGFGVRP